MPARLPGRLLVRSIIEDSRRAYYRGTPANAFGYPYCSTALQQACYYSVLFVLNRKERLVNVELYSSDAFTEKKEDLLARFQSDYRFQRGDEIYVERGEGRPLKVRLIDVRVFVSEDGSTKSELLAMKL